MEPADYRDLWLLWGLLLLLLLNLSLLWRLSWVLSDTAVDHLLAVALTLTGLTLASTILLAYLVLLRMGSHWLWRRCRVSHSIHWRLLRLTRGWVYHYLLSPSFLAIQLTVVNIVVHVASSIVLHHVFLAGGWRWLGLVAYLWRDHLLVLIVVLHVVRMQLLRMRMHHLLLICLIHLHHLLLGNSCCVLLNNLWLTVQDLRIARALLKLLVMVPMMVGSSRVDDHVAGSLLHCRVLS